MTSAEEIERRIEQADSAQTVRRADAAKRVSELARQQAAVAQQLNDIETELGEVLADASEVIGVDELARFTDVPAADLARWRDGRKSARTKRKRTARQEAVPSGAAAPGVSAADAPVRVPVAAT
ncbi:hypothetical protein [Amycolatopsis sp. H20-H5]|uniref:hypothetical protein n=1 Tax=Amycolatopsis sp. H20-H5 TaxID=3046309 RepID=UPI002DB99C3F|nr:hypothetical protein [Amycolatopsis sp. H20-H5]MEC3974325.1 hypothetical protein [Amycolatopsis sp. H20-H5]